jgi:hypothetical protein
MEKAASEQEKLLISRLEKHPEFVRAIGMISIENANIEAQMARLFSRILFIPLHVGFAIYLTPKSATARIEIFQKAIKAALRPTGPEEHQKKLKDALDKANRLANRVKTVTGKRHQIIHDVWGVDETGDVVRKPLPAFVESEKVPITKLNNMIREMRTLSREIRDTAEEFRQSPPSLVSMATTSQDKSQPQTQDRQQSS